MSTSDLSRRAGGPALALGVLAFSGGDLLRRVVEPTSPSVATTTAAVRAQAGTWFAAGALELLSALLLVAGAIAVVRLAPARGRTLTVVGATLLGIGGIASTGHTIGYYGTYAAYADSGLDTTALAAMNETTDALGGITIALFMLGMLLGPVLLTTGLRRAGVVPIWIPVLAVVFVVAGAVSGVAAGLIGLLAGLVAFGYVGLIITRSRTATPVPTPRPQPSPAI
ncbi:MAG TPA: hypothetical protein VFL94_05535 [Actinomycetales bacterium]|nr:hypothetical protein [Actinomycetales bacterium]